MNHARSDWAFTVARRYLYEHADATRLESLVRSTYAPVAELAAKMRREETYHLLHFDIWLQRLAEAGGEARERLVTSLERLWPDAQAVFAPLAGEASLVSAGILPDDLETLRGRWLEHVVPVLESFDLPVPPQAERAASPAGDGRTRRSDDFAWLHGEFTMVARSDKGATW
jgi:ring-1,2-phenylacetyl-CoA epoxidase subunit PaaC